MTAAPVVLLHAFPLSSAMWQGQHLGLAAAAGVEIELITPDLYGFGSAPMSMDEPDLGWMAEAVMRLLDQRGLRQVVLGGLSMGGYVVMEILRRRPSLAVGLVLADTKAAADTPEAKERRERMAAVLEERRSSRVLVHEVLPSLLSDTTRSQQPKVADLVREEVERADPMAAAWAQRAMAARPDSFDVLKEADVPAVVVVGLEDLLTPVGDAGAMVEALPQGTLSVIEGSGHLSAVESPKAFNAVVGEFLRSVPGPG